MDGTGVILAMIVLIPSGIGTMDILMAIVVLFVEMRLDSGLFLVQFALFSVLVEQYTHLSEFNPMWVITARIVGDILAHSATINWVD